MKVLDFGLAKALGHVVQDFSPAVGGSKDPPYVAMTSPTLSVGVTQAGMILGTAAYMSPEQAKGRAADKRSDVWAFGCVLYEMLAGKRAFDGEDVTDIIAAVVRGEPDWNALPADVPEQIRLLVKRCLEKDRRARIGDISVARFLMTETIAPGQSPEPTAQSLKPGAQSPEPKVQSRRLVWTSVGLLVGAAIAGVGGWAAMKLAPTRPAQPARFAIVPPAAQALAIQGQDRDIAISPDGSRIVYRAGSPPQLFVRAIEQLDATPISGTAGARAPFMSPDGRWVGFFTGISGSDTEVKKVSIAGGPAITLCKVSGLPRGASWGDDDTIVFATANPATGLMSVPAGGGEPKILTKPEPGQGDHVRPSVLPGATGVLFSIGGLGQGNIATAAQGTKVQVAILNMKSGERTTLIQGGSQAEYVATGHLIYASAGTLHAVRFDLARLQVLSDPIPVVEQVLMPGTSSAANFAVSLGGTLVYMPGTGIGAGAPRTLVWANRQGREEPLNVPPRAYAYPQISPDGARVALDVRDQNNDIWVWEFARQTLTPLTFDPAPDISPVWSPDGRRIVFSSGRNGQSNLFWQAADGTGPTDRLTTGPNQQIPTSFSSDTRSLVFQELMPAGDSDIGLLALGDPATSLGAGPSTRSAGSGSTVSTVEPSTSLGAGKGRIEPLIHTGFNELNAEISPDGRWLAYQSNESGWLEVYVRPFPKVDSGRWQVSTGGGTRPLWARNGRELFYLDGNNLLTSVPVQTAGSTFSAGNPTKILNTAYWVTLSGRTYDASPDGQRFLMIKDAAATQTSTATPASMVVVINWFEELRARAGK